jgi:hypothetical protein
MRRAHWLTPNRRTSQVQTAVWVDTETHARPAADGSTTHHLWFGWFCWQRRRADAAWTAPVWRRFTTSADFWDHLTRLARPHTKLSVYAHNWAFDAPVLATFTELPGRGWTLATAVLDSPPVILTWRQGRRALQMLDTLNWWRMPLESIGASVGLAKLPMPARRTARVAWDTYCRRDVEVIRRAIHAWWTFLRREDLGHVCPTVGSQALTAFRHRFQRHPGLIDQHPMALALARDALHGGRVEAFRIGTVREPVTLVDVTSMYPAVMATEPMPTILRGHWRDVSLTEVERVLTRSAVVARCRVRIDRPYLPMVRDERLLFPVGEFSACLSTPELRRALDAGELVEVTELAVYDQAVLFEAYVTELYDHRRAALAGGRTVDAWLLKILLNSLYGKFCQRGDTWHTVELTDDLTVATWSDWDVETRTLTRWRRLGGAVQRLTREPESHDSHPAIAAHVTAHARLRLWHMMERAGLDEVLYVDTDALMVTSRGLANLTGDLGERELGKLNVVATYPTVTILGAKDYVTPANRVLKGVRRSAVWQTERDLIQDQWDTLAGQVARGSLSAPRVHGQPKHLTRAYEKGILGADGRVSPWTFDGGRGGRGHD